MTAQLSVRERRAIPTYQTTGFELDFAKGDPLYKEWTSWTTLRLMLHACYKRMPARFADMMILKYEGDESEKSFAIRFLVELQRVANLDYNSGGGLLSDTMPDTSYPAYDLTLFDETGRYPYRYADARPADAPPVIPRQGSARLGTTNNNGQPQTDTRPNNEYPGLGLTLFDDETSSFPYRYADTRPDDAVPVIPRQGSGRLQVLQARRSPNRDKRDPAYSVNFTDDQWRCMYLPARTVVQTPQFHGEGAGTSPCAKAFMLSAEQKAEVKPRFKRLLPTILEREGDRPVDTIGCRLCDIPNTLWTFWVFMKYNCQGRLGQATIEKGHIRDHIRALISTRRDYEQFALSMIPYMNGQIDQAAQVIEAQSYRELDALLQDTDNRELRSDYSEAMPVALIHRPVTLQPAANAVGERSAPSSSMSTSRDSQTSRARSDSQVGETGSLGRLPPVKPGQSRKKQKKAGGPLND